MATFVLVHGAFAGGWYWRRVREGLERAGHTVFTPTLTGAGERAHLLSRDIHLSTHIEDVANVLHYEDLTRVVLVGHSYGGMVITGVAERAPQRLAALVYLDAAAPVDGQTATGGFAAGTGEVLQGMAAGTDWLLPPVPLGAFGVTDPEVVAWAQPRRTPHPLHTLSEPVTVRNPVAAQLMRRYIRCTRRAELVAAFGADPLAPFVERVRAEGWPFTEIDSGHDAMVIAPDAVVAALVEAAAPGAEPAEPAQRAR
ncbi:MAG: alpha/beta fold hydrolase [Polyangia bacterium]